MTSRWKKQPVRQSSAETLSSTETNQDFSEVNELRRNFSNDSSPGVVCQVVASGGAVDVQVDYADDTPPKQNGERASSLDLGPFTIAAQDVGPVVAQHGFAVVKHVLSVESSHRMVMVCDKITRDMLNIDTKCSGNRGTGRYSMGSASQSGQQLHNPEWALLLTDPVLDAMESVYGEDGFLLRGGGGEVVLGNVLEYQDLHADIAGMPPHCDTQLRPPSMIVNFAIHPIAEDQGPTRIWPGRGRPRDTGRAPTTDKEPAEVLRSVLAPLPSGSCVVRDGRIWHGGTPNWQNGPRYLPNLEFFSREYAQYNATQGHSNRFNQPTMTQEVFSLLTPRAKRVVSGLVATGPVAGGINRNFVKLQGQALRDDLFQKLSRLQMGETFSYRGRGYECQMVKDIAEARGMLCQVRNGTAIVRWPFY